MGLRKWLIRLLGGMPREDHLHYVNNMPISRALAAKAICQSRLLGNRAVRGVARTNWYEVPVITHYTIRIDRPRKKLKKPK